MTRTRLSLAAAMALGLGLPVATAFAQAQGGASKAATVNVVTIPAARIDSIVKSQAARVVPDSPQLRSEVREHLIVREIVAQEATRKGLAKNATQLQFSLRQA